MRLPNAVAIEDDGFGRLDDGIAEDGKIGDLLCIPAIGTQVDTLFYPTLQRQQQIVFYQLGLPGVILMGGHLNKDKDAVGMFRQY